MRPRRTRGATLLTFTDNVFDIGSHRPLETLIQELGGLEECQRLGFVFEDENKIMSQSTAGLGYLLS
jgi:hypothetical protein